MAAIALISAVAAIAACGLRSTNTPLTAVPLPYAEVIAIIDGDTLDVRFSPDRVERIRLLGIDTPESVSRVTPEQCYGAEASAALAQLLPVGTIVRVERDAEARDRYGRLLAYVYRRDDELMVNQWLLDEGYAAELSYEPNTTYRGDFLRRQREAREHQRGLWGACDGPDQPL